MTLSMKSFRRPARSFAAVLALVAAAFAIEICRAGDASHMTAREGVALAYSAARAWAEDAELVYLENDEDLSDAGTSARWGYLFRSETLEGARGYSVAGGKVVQAGDLGFRFDPPPIEAGWIDSQTALQTAEEKAGLEFRAKEGGSLDSMLLLRGASDPKKPERTSWLVVYRAEGRPSLFVLVDAVDGDVHRKWRG